LTKGSSVALVALLLGCQPGERGRVLIVGIDGASLRVAATLLEEGRLPHLGAIAAQGASGLLRSAKPLISPRIWTTVATGKTPKQHGILQFLVRDAGQQRLYRSSDRKGHALWNIASDHELSVAVVNWWTTYPPEVVRGVMVSDHALAKQVEELERWSGAAPGEVGPSVYPEERADRTLTLLGQEHELVDLPDPFRGNRALPAWTNPARLSRILERDAAYTAVALALDAELRPDVLMLLLTGIDRISHTLWGALESQEIYPPTLRMNEDQQRAARAALEQTYVYTDALIGRLLAGYGPDDLVMVLSDHGFEGMHTRGTTTGNHRTDKALDGVLFARGRGIAAGTSTEGAGIADITPTVLAWLGLPLGADMEGAPLAVLDVKTVAEIETHDRDNIQRLDGLPSGRDPEILRELEGLGYIED
jgi:predicted AlkP superfamily phosphohydrolase/phosphomutase